MKVGLAVLMLKMKVRMRRRWLGLTLCLLDTYYMLTGRSILWLEEDVMVRLLRCRAPVLYRQGLGHVDFTSHLLLRLPIFRHSKYIPLYPLRSRRLPSSFPPDSTRSRSTYLR